MGGALLHMTDVLDPTSLAHVDRHLTSHDFALSHGEPMYFGASGKGGTASRTSMVSFVGRVTDTSFEHDGQITVAAAEDYLKDHPKATTVQLKTLEDMKGFSDPRVASVKKKLIEEEERIAAMDGEKVDTAGKVSCSLEEQKLTSEGWEEFGGHLCKQLKREGYNVWPLRVSVAESKANHNLFLQAADRKPDVRNFLTMAEVPPERRAPGDMGDGDDDHCGCGPGHGWDSSAFKCSRELEPAVSPGLESHLCQTIGQAPKRGPSELDKCTFADKEDHCVPDKPPSTSDSKVYVRPLEVKPVHVKDGKFVGTFLKVPKSADLEGKEFMIFAASRGSQEA
eukprot:TRINITY_DN48673_c0_g1_i1.p1 TRINITY_DN48673_c0_g1~~TRINITY_DN48673_c0_g1_i1.p1  ORF type:complete len:338 (-),score=56.55 TRINITY_DN48673_c0_g1_i1:166-1179(-)